MEHTANAVMVPMNAGWSDIGSWAALSALMEQDDRGNTAQGDVVLEGTRNISIMPTNLYGPGDDFQTCNAPT